jgi:hypothetical protein
MDIPEHSNAEKMANFRSITGLILLLSGGILFLDRYLQTGWLSLLILPTIGLFLYAYGMRLHHARLIFAGGLMGGVGVGVAAALNPLMQPQALTAQIGMVAVYTGIGWLLVTITIYGYTNQTAWWALVPTGVLLGLGAGMLYTQMHWLNFVFTLGLGSGLALLAWGLLTRLIGLIIPGCLLMTAGAGIYFSWQLPGEANTLMQTGIMLIWFALGWVLITLSMRAVSKKYLWWPLIPGGILAMVGFGLYIGGDPSNALGFISNTGAIVLMVFGLYLLLMRKGIHHD